MNDSHDDPAAPATAEHRLLHAILRGEAPAWDAAGDAGLAQSFLALCRAEDVMALVHHRLRRSPAWDVCPEALREPLAHAARMQAAVDMLRERELVAVLAALAAAGIDCLLLKGTPLAHSHYPEPAPTTELSARYLHANRRRVLLTDLRALPTWGERAVLLRETLFPPADYLLAKYGARSRWLLPWWYLRRAAEGVLKGR